MEADVTKAERDVWRVMASTHAMTAEEQAAAQAVRGAGPGARPRLPRVRQPAPSPEVGPRYRSGVALIPEASEHPPRRVRPGAPARLAAGRRQPPVARAAHGRGPRVHQLLDALVALLAVAGQPDHRPVRAAARHQRQRDHARAPRARPGRADRRQHRAGGRLPLVLHRQVAPLARAAARHGRLRLLRLGGQRPPLHGLGRHRRALRSRHRRQRRPLAAHQRRVARPALVPHRGPGEPARRDVVPDRPALLPARPRRAGGRGPQHPRAGQVEGRRPAPDLHRRLRGGLRRAAGQLRRRPAHQARGAPPVALGPAARAVGLHRPRRQEGLAAPPRLLREAPAHGRREPGHRAVRAGGDRRVGRHDHHVHVRPRRHVRLARAAVEGTVRLQRDHEGAAVRAGAGCDGRRFGHVGARHPRRPGHHHRRPGRGVAVRPAFAEGRRPHPGVRRSRGIGARPRAVRHGLGPHREHQQDPLRGARLLRRPPQVRALLRRGRRLSLHRAVGQRPRHQAVRRRRRLRRPGPRVVRPPGGPPRARQPGPRPRPPRRAPPPVRPHAHLRQVGRLEAAEFAHGACVVRTRRGQGAFLRVERAGLPPLSAKSRGYT